MVPEAETEALSLAAPVADKKKNGALGSPLLSPNFTEFDRCLAEFKQVARGAYLVETADLPVLESAVGVQERLG